MNKIVLTTARCGRFVASAAAILLGAACTNGSTSDSEESGEPADQEVRDENSGEATSAAITIPPGFSLINSWTGVSVYKKDWAGGYPDFVTIIDLGKASLQSLTGTTNSAPCATVGRKSIGAIGAGTYWAAAQAADTLTKKTRVVLSGTFFNPTYDSDSSPTGISFGLKKDGQVLSYGYGVNNGVCGNANEAPGGQLLFGFNQGGASAWIGGYSKAQMDNGTPNYAGAWGSTCCKKPSIYTGRTLVGIRDDNSNGVYETVMFFSSKSAMLTGVNGADDTLKNFGATVRANFDGGGSTGLVVNGSVKIATARKIPHAFAVYSPN